MIRLVEVGLVEVGLALGRDAVAFAGIVSVRDAVRPYVVESWIPVHVLVAGPPRPDLVGNVILERSVRRLELGHVVMALHVGPDRGLPDDVLSGSAVATLVRDAVVVVVDPVVRVAGGLEVGVAEVAGLAAVAGPVDAVPEAVPGVDQVQARRLVPEGVVVVGFVDAVARQPRSAYAGVHVESENDVVVVVGRALVRDVVVPEDHVSGLRVGPLEPAHLDAHAEPAARGIAGVGVVEPSVVVVVVHDGVALLVGGRPLAEVAVPAPRPARVERVVLPVGPVGGPCARVVADRGCARAVQGRVGLEVARPRLVAGNVTRRGTRRGRLGQGPAGRRHDERGSQRRPITMRRGPK